MRVEMCQFSKPVLVSLEKTDCLTTFRPVIRILASEKAKQNKSGNQDKICRWLSYKVQIWFARNVLPQLFPSSHRSSFMLPRLEIISISVILRCQVGLPFYVGLLLLIFSLWTEKSSLCIKLNPQPVSCPIRRLRKLVSKVKQKMSDQMLNNLVECSTRCI